MKTPTPPRPRLESLESRDTPTAFTVNSLADGGVGSGTTGDLRYCLGQANASGGPDTIDFSVTGSILLGSALPPVADDVTLTGPGAAGLTVDGNDAVRVLDVAAGVTVVASGLTLADGFDPVEGGAVRNAGTLTLTACVVTSSTAGAGGAAGAGGGVFNAATGNLTLDRCTVSDNVSSDVLDPTRGGGGVMNVGIFQATGSTFSGNQAAGAGGGLMNTGTAGLFLCTVAGNRAGGGGGVENLASLGVSDTTIAGNLAGGGLSTGAGGSLFNSVVAGNLLGGAPGDITGAVNVLSAFNLIGDLSSSGGLSNGVNGNIVGVADPGLAPLGDYGGPTQTVALLPGSPALDAGGAPARGGAVTDQRGLPRVANLPGVTDAAGSDGRDIGAFESRGFVLAATGTPQTTVAGQPFAAPLGVTLTANDANVPLGGIPVTYTPPAAGPTAALAPPAVALAAAAPGVGAASVTATADGTLGAYLVTAAVAGVDPVSFDLTNAPAPTTTTPAGAAVLFSPAAQTVPLSAAVTSAFGTVNGGSVTFTVFSGATVVGIPVTAAVTGGVASAPYILPGGIAPGGLTISAAFSPGATTFAASSGTAALTVGKINQSIAFTVTSPVTYGVAPITLTATATSGLPVSISLVSGPGTLSGNVLTVTGAGDIVLRADQPGDAVFNPAAPVTRTLTVLPAPLTVRADDVTRTFGAANPAFSATFTGLVNGDTPADLTGTLAFATPAGTASAPGTYPVTPSGLSSPDYVVTFADGTLTVTPPAAGGTPPITPPAAPIERVAVGAGPGGGPRVQVFDPAGSKLFDFFAYDDALRGGVAVATGDVNGDGTEDVITGAGDGGGTHVKVFDGLTLSPLASYFAYGELFRGGVWVSAGDVDGDGKAEVITGPGVGGGPAVVVWSLASGTPAEVTRFLAFEESFRGGVTVAYGRDAAAAPVIVTGAGLGGAPRVRTFDALTHRMLADVLAFEPSFTGGVYVASGDVFGGGTAEALVGPGAGGGPRLRVLGFDGAEEADLFAALDTLRNGLTVAARARPADSAAILVGAGQGAFEGELGEGSLDGLTRVGFFEPAFLGGVFVG